MLVSIVSVRFFVSCFVRVEKNVRKYENLMIFVYFVIFNRGVPCVKIVQWSWSFGNIPSSRCINRISPSVSEIRILMKKTSIFDPPYWTCVMLDWHPLHFIDVLLAQSYVWDFKLSIGKLYYREKKYFIICFFYM